MNLKTLCRNQCANYINGICLGVIINRDLSQWFDMELAGKPCCVDKCRCYYFENIIIPLVRLFRKHPDYLQMSKAVRMYETINFEMKLVRHCRQCGEPVPDMKQNQKYCTKCASERKQQAKRNHKRLKRRKSA
ncbi:hypothetical protein ACFL4H_01700 [Candidatus Neomarinimicrobiota bacterium]